MEWGMKNRLSRLFQKNGKALFLPIDHGYFQGPTRCLEKPAETIKPIYQYADALMLTRGVLRNCIDPAIEKPIIIRVSGAVSVVGEDLANESLVTSIGEILRLNASAVSMSVFVGSQYENKSLTNLARLIDECEDYGVPVMAVCAVGKELEKREARYLALSARIAAEIGARVVKTYYCKENFEKIINGCPVPVVIAGGPKTETQREVFDFVYDGIQKGAAGVNLGRNIWQTEHPVASIRAIRAIIHDDYTAQEADDFYNQIKANRA
ncbi:MAG: 3-hydroxy-5-phosphonooxypentane-2,4-dione thiolase [Nitrososphaerota archaeon]|jgi:putative autoinducer-2 (AI-2) aldolase|nr:3-hydroxy-5-phosphonooxypentane-2,4-dione thiolase [Nitrososphaerota archaeon]